MWEWLEPHDLYWRRVSQKMHSHLHTKDNKGMPLATCPALDPSGHWVHTGLACISARQAQLALGIMSLQISSTLFPLYHQDLC